MMWILAALLAVAMLPFSAALACDPCALYSVSRLHGHSSGSFSFAVSEQFTGYSRGKATPENSARDAEYTRGYSSTYFTLGYDFLEQLGVQLSLPLITRRFDKVEGYRTSTETDSGLGDTVLLGSYTFLNNVNTDWAVISGMFAGVKFPTGDSGNLGDLSAEAAAIDRHHPISGASGGRALTFGSGSYDYIAGLNLLTRHDRFVLLSDAQYTLRTEGDFDYEFADDFLFSAAAGYYFAADHDLSAAGLLAFSGEFKGKDHLAGELVKGSELSNLYLGPKLLFLIGSSLGLEAALDIRVSDEDSDAEIVPETRLRASLTYRLPR